MKDYSTENLAPWHPFRNEIAFISLDEGVTSIGSFAFSQCSNAMECMIPATITSVGRYAFKECQSLNEISLPEGITRVSYGCFDGCTDLETVNLPSTIKSIDREAFIDCKSLKNIDLPEGLTTIGIASFRACYDLENLILPQSVTEFGDQAFWYVAGPVNVSTLMAYYKLKNNASYIDCEVVYTGTDEPQAGELTYSIYNDTCTITGYTGFYASIVIPTAIDGYKVVAVGYGAFKDATYIETITIPDSVASIDSYAFAHCISLKSVSIPEGVSRISYGCFDGCTNLETVNLPSTIKSIDRDAFIDCKNLKSIDLPEGLTTIGVASFRACYDLENLILPQSVIEFDDQAFWYIAGPVKASTLTAYYKLKNNASYIDCEVIYTGTDEPQAGELTYSIYNDTCTITGYTGFNASIEIPEKIEGFDVVSIGYEAFKDATYIETITIPDSVASIDSYAFAHCVSLKSVSIPEGVSRISYGCFDGCTGLETVNLPSTIKSIDRDAFIDCKSLKNIDLPEGLTTIGVASFRACYDLENLILPQSVTEFGDQAFWYMGYHTSNPTIHVNSWPAYWKLEGNTDYIQSWRDVTILHPIGTPVVEGVVTNSDWYISVSGDLLLTSAERHTEYDSIKVLSSLIDRESAQFDALLEDCSISSDNYDVITALDISLIGTDSSNGSLYELKDTPDGMTATIEVGQSHNGERIHVISKHIDSDYQVNVYNYGTFTVKNGILKIPAIRGFSEFVLLNDGKQGVVDSFTAVRTGKIITVSVSTNNLSDNQIIVAAYTSYGQFLLCKEITIDSVGQAEVQLGGGTNVSILKLFAVGQETMVPLDFLELRL